MRKWKVEYIEDCYQRPIFKSIEVEAERISDAVFAVFFTLRHIVPGLYVLGGTEIQPETP